MTTSLWCWYVVTVTSSQVHSAQCSSTMDTTHTVGQSLHQWRTTSLWCWYVVTVTSSQVHSAQCSSTMDTTHTVGQSLHQWRRHCDVDMLSRWRRLKCTVHPQCSSTMDTTHTVESVISLGLLVFRWDFRRVLNSNWAKDQPKSEVVFAEQFAETKLRTERSMNPKLSNSPVDFTCTK